MKKLSVILALSFICFYTNAQKIKETAVPDLVLNSFTNNFPDASGVTWTKSDNLYQANFNQARTVIKAILDSLGNIKETDQQINNKEIPPRVQQYVQQYFPKQKIKDSYKIIEPDGTIKYEIELNANFLYFTETGEFLVKKEKAN